METTIMGYIGAILGLYYEVLFSGDCRLQQERGNETCRLRFRKH